MAKATETTVLSPAPMTEAQEKWDSLTQEALHGASQEFDPVYYAKRYPDLVKYYNEKVAVKSGPFGVPLPTGRLMDPAKLTGDQIAWLKDHWEQYGRKENRSAFDPAASKAAALAGTDLRGKIGVDTEHQKAADYGMLNEITGFVDNYLGTIGGTVNDRINANQVFGQNMGGITGGYLDQIAGNRKEVSGVMDTVRPVATSAPITASIGGFSTPHFTKSQRYSQGALSDLVNQRQGLDQTGFNAQSNQEALMNSLAMQNAGFTDTLAGEALSRRGTLADIANQMNQRYVPNLADNRYLDVLMQEQQRQDALRYGLPTTTNTAEYKPSWQENLGTVLGGAGKFMEGIASIPGFKIPGLG